MKEPLLILAKNYGDEAIFIAYETLGQIKVQKGGITEQGVQHYSVVFFDKQGNILATNEGYPSFSRAMFSVETMGIKVIENK